MIGLLVMLAFGVVIGGAFSSGGLGALANTIVVAVRPSVQQAAQVVTTVASRTVAAAAAGDGHRSSRRRRWWRRRGRRRRRAAATVPAAPAPAPVTVTVSQSESTNPAPGRPRRRRCRSIDHVWLIVLGQQGYQQAWATSAGHPYLGNAAQAGRARHQLRRGGVLAAGQRGRVALGPGPDAADGRPTARSYTYIDPGSDRQAAAGARRRLHLPADDRVAAPAVRRRRLELEGVHPGDR